MANIELIAMMTVAAFAGGVLGTMIGALHTFILAGIVVIAGEAANLAGRNVGAAVGGDPAALGAVGVTANIGFGAVLGPQITFAGAVAATAYAAKKGYMESNWGYHYGKNIFRAFSCHRLDVLLVGGIFGSFGYLATYAIATLGVPVDPIAASIVVSAAVHRVVLGYSVFGNPLGESRFDLSPFEQEEVVADVQSEEAVRADGGIGEPADRLAVEPWIPWMYQWNGLVVLGAAGGLLGGLTYYMTGSPFLVFGISAASLMLLNDGLEDNFAEMRITIPLTHHITLPGSAAVFAFSGLSMAQSTPANIAAAVPLWQALAVGTIFGIVGALFGEISQRIVYAHADTHWDPPATAIMLSTILIGVLAIIGVFPSGGYIPTP